MSDILQDQKIHYIVKDYRRMFEMHEQLVDAIKKATTELEKRDKKITYLERRLTKRVSVAQVAVLKDIARRANDQFLSVGAHAKKGQKILEELMQAIQQPEEVEPEETEEDENAL